MINLQDNKNKMPTLKAFTIHDTKAGTYSRPMFSMNKATMIRQFTDIASDKQHPIGQHPEDYILYAIGEFDEFSGELTASKHIALGKAIDYIKPTE